MATTKKAARRKQRPLPAGIYTGRIVGISPGRTPGQLSLHWEIDSVGKPKGMVTTLTHIANTLDRFFVAYSPLKIYTTIGAKNIHHAVNKATKNFAGKYTSVSEGSDWREDTMQALGYTFQNVAKYNALIAEVQD